jgi:hypothetical protein
LEGRKRKMATVVFSGKKYERRERKWGKCKRERKEGRKEKMGCKGVK